MKFLILLCILVGSGVAALPAAAQSFDRRLIEGCVPCHSADGISRFGEVPNLAGQNEPYLLNQLRAFHTGKRTHKQMQYMSHDLTEKDMEAIADYFSHLPPR